MTDDAADKLLVQRIRNGDSGAWEEFISRYEGRLMAFINSRLNNRAASEDAVQETFMGFLISLPNYDDKNRLETYLFSIAAHKLTDHLRREGRRPTLPLATSNSRGSYIEPTGPGRHASSLVRSQEGRGAEKKVITECMMDLIAGWVERSEYERLMCIELLFVLGWANKDVAQRLEISEQAVANHKHFVVSKLKEAAERARLQEFDLSEFGL